MTTLDKIDRAERVLHKIVFGKATIIFFLAVAFVIFIAIVRSETNAQDSFEAAFVLVLSLYCFLIAIRLAVQTMSCFLRREMISGWVSFVMLIIVAGMAAFGCTLAYSLLSTKYPTNKVAR